MRRLLLDGLNQLSLDAGLADSLLAYLELLQKWNKAYNLTAIRDPHDMVVLHLLDSLTVLPYLRGTAVLDVGTGAGLPGIPLAIAHPDVAFTLLDTNGKKTRFIEYAVRQLGVANVRVEKSRIEEYAPPDKFTTIVSRAFSSLDAFARVCHPLLRTDGYLLAMKGKLPKEEIDALNKAQWEVSSQPVDVPGLDAERHMVMLGPLS